MTIGFGVASGIGAAEPTCDALVESQIEFLQDFTIEAYIDGIKIENFYTSGEYDVAEFSYTEEGDCFGTTRYHYFIPPLSQGTHTYTFQIYYGSSLIIHSFTQITVTPRL